MCEEVLSDVHVYNKFDLLPDTGKSKAISRFQFYLPSSKEVTIVSLCDVKEPPTKKLKLSQDVSQANDSLETVVDGLQSNKPILKEQVIIWLDAIQKLSVDNDGDLVLERHPPRGLVSESPESSDHDSEEESHPRQPVLDNTESSDDGGKNSQRTGSVTYRCTDTQTRLHDDQELCFITLRHSLATELNEVGEQVWLGALLLCDYIIYRGFDFRDKTVVDLGSGTGLTSVVAALFANTVYCTDIGENILDIARHNVSNQTLLQEHSPYNIHVKELDWFKPVKVSEERGLYGLTQEDVSEILSAEIVVAADVVYDNDITDAFMNTVLGLMAEPANKRLLIGLEKRLVFTIEDLDIASPAYNHFRTKLEEVESLSRNRHVTYRVEQVDTDFPQYFKYNRTKQLELWMVEAIFAGT